MCDPLTIATVATVGAGALQAGGQIKQGFAQSDQYKYMGNVLDARSALARQQAEQNNTLTENAAAFQAQSSFRNAAQVEGTQKAAIGANGIGGSVTAADIAGDSFDREKLDQIAIRYNADTKKWENNRAADLEVWDNDNQKRQALRAAKNARQSGYINAGATLLGTAASVAGGYAKFGGGTGAGTGGVGNMNSGFNSMTGNGMFIR